jgi:CRISPR-associated protein Csx3
MVRLDFPPELDLERGVILYGRAPTWLYGYLVGQLAHLPWVACYDIRTKAAVVVSSNVSEVQPGDALPITFSQTPSAAILIGGSPDSGKSVLSNALRVSLAAKCPELRIYLHRANWDGEGNHTYETPEAELADRLKQENKFKIHEHWKSEELLREYFDYQARATENIRRVVDVALVDVGGVPQPAKVPLVEQCSHYIVISNDPTKVQAWHDLCGSRSKLIAVIHSVWEDKVEVLRRKPFLELIAGRWDRRRMRGVPEVLLEEILNRVG